VVEQVSDHLLVLVGLHRVLYAVERGATARRKTAPHHHRLAPAPKARPQAGRGVALALHALNAGTGGAADLERALVGKEDK